MSPRAARRPALRWIRLFLVLASGALLTFLLARWETTLAWIGEFPICSDRLAPADLILVMGGDFWGPRVLTGADLGKQKYAPLVLISGPPYRGRPEGELAVDFLVSRGYPRSLFAVFGHNEGSTVGEAIMLRREFERRHVKRVIVVTSNYHSRRSKIVLSLFCRGIKFMSAPSPDSHYDPTLWWHDAAMRDLFEGEIAKILGSVFVAYPRYLVSALWSKGAATAREKYFSLPRALRSGLEGRGSSAPTLFSKSPRT